MTRMRSAHSHPTAGCACMGGLTITVKRPLNISRGGIFSPQIAAGRGAGEKWRTIGSWCTFAKWIKIFQQKPFKSGYAQAEAGWNELPGLRAGRASMLPHFAPLVRA